MKKSIILPRGLQRPQLDSFPKLQESRISLSFSTSTKFPNKKTLYHAYKLNIPPQQIRDKQKQNVTVQR